MATLADLSARQLARARADQVATLYASWHRTTASMVLGAAILCFVLWDLAALWMMGVWIAAILANQAWRGALVRAYRRAQPGIAAAPRWGIYWALGSTLAGALWGTAAIVLYPASPPHEALLIVCFFSVILGGLNLTAVYKPSFYGFVLAALVPLIARVAVEGDQVHLFTALVLGVVLAFVLAFGRQVNDILTQSLAMRYENVDLIGELRAQSEAAESARSAAENANRAKSQFLAAASHDLRQPMHAMGLFATALATKARDPELRPLVASIQASVDALERLFGQLLDLSRLDGGTLRPVRTSVPLAPLFERLEAEFAPQAAACGLSLRCVRTRLAVDSDPVLLVRILRNLVANAARYTEKGGIVIGARHRGNGVRIDVVDTGAGIADADRRRIFDEFVQLSTAPRRHAAGHGMGLGLAIVRRLCALLGHDVQLASTLHRGSRFSIVVPRVAPSGPEAAAGRSASPPIAVGAFFTGRRIVVVDDDPSVIAAMRALFDARGARVTGGEDAAAALAMLRTADGARPPGADLIVADLRLAEGASGLDAVAALRNALGRQVPALIVSGDTGADARTEVRRAGLRLLAKPVVAATLEHAAAMALLAEAATSESD
jgi:signal transduction histidine kinase/ActR/RegA family two-component response regulator